MSSAVPRSSGAARIRQTPGWQWWACAALAVAAMGLRAVLEGWLGGTLPFVFAFLAVVAAALLAGSGPAMLTLAVCALWGLVPGLPPVTDGRQVLTFVASGLAVTALCAFANRRRSEQAAGDGVADAATARDDVQQWLQLLIVLALLLPAIFFAATAWQGRQEALRHAEERVVRGALLASEHALKVLRTAQTLIERAEDETAALGDDELRGAAGSVAATRLQRMLHSAPELRSLSIWDAQGRLLLATRPVPAGLDVSQREYFVAQRDADAGLFVSQKLTSLSDNQSLRVVVSRRRAGPGGSFGGVIAAALEASTFDDFYRDLTLAEAGASVSLFRPDGSVVARHPPLPVAGLVVPTTGRMITRVRRGEVAGVETIESPIDGRRRLAAFRQVQGFPLYVSSTIAHDAILGGWHRDIALLAAFTFPPSFALAWVSWVAAQRSRRERLAMQRWRDETAKRAQAEEALRQTQRLEALGHLTGGVAHDVNNLLMVVSNNAYLLRRLLQKELGAAPPVAAPPVPPHLDKPIAAILRAVGTGARLTRQLLAFARRQALRPEVVSLPERLPLLLDLMRHSVSARIAVDGEAAADAGSVEVDPAELELAMINLAVNARDAMPDGGRIFVKAMPLRGDQLQGLDRQRDWVGIEVSDSGCGIAPEDLPRVFEPFFTTKEPGKGTGLGLSQVYGFCRQAGGIARIHSAPGQGTTVQLLLPASGQAQSPQAEPEPVPAAQGRLLLVEDNAEVAAATEPLLASWGYEVTAARSGEEAQALLQQRGGDVELMLSDIVMPGATNGVALARWVRTRFPRIGIVLTTGYASETGSAMAEGFAVLQKPWTPEQLAAALARARQPATTGS